MTPISVEVIAPVLTDLRHCSHCEVIFAQTEVGPQVHKEVLDEYPLDLKEDFERLSDWLVELAHRYGDALSIKVIDPQSIEGFVKSVRHWVRRYPAFITGRPQGVRGVGRRCVGSCPANAHQRGKPWHVGQRT